MSNTLRSALFDQIVDGLSRLREHPGAFIVQIGDYYVQFRDTGEVGGLEFGPCPTSTFRNQAGYPRTRRNLSSAWASTWTTRPATSTRRSPPL